MTSLRPFDESCHAGPEDVHILPARGQQAPPRHGMVLGTLASVINHAFAAIDELAVTHDEPIRGEDLLGMMTVSLPPPDDGEHPS